MASAITLSINANRRPEQLADLTRDLVSDLQRERALNANHVTISPSVAERSGDVMLLGQIALTFLSGGAATALIVCLKAYIQRDPTLRFRLKKADGTELELEAKNFDPSTIANTAQALKRLADAED